MAKQAGITAKIGGDASGLKAALRDVERDSVAWAQRMATMGQRAVAGGRGGGGAGMALLQVGQAVDDVQYGLRGILNNIPGVVMSLGGSMGLAGAASIATVAMYQLGKAFFDFEADAKRADAAKDLIKELDKKLVANAERHQKEDEAAAQKALADAVAAANERFREQSENIERNANLTQRVADARLELAKAEVAASDANDSEKILANLKLESDAAQAEHEAALKRIDDETMANEERFKTMQRLGAAAKEFQEVNRKYFDLINQRQILEQTFETQQRARAVEAQGEIQKRAEVEAEAAQKRSQQMEHDRQAYRADMQTQRQAAKEKEQAQAKSLANAQAEAEITGLRSRGRNRAADRKERELRIQNEADRLQKETGLEPDAARDLAEQLNPDPRRRGRINTKSRRRIEAEGIGRGTSPFMYDATNEIPRTGLPREKPVAGKHKSRDVLEKATEGNGSRDSKQVISLLKDIKTNTDGQSKGRSEPLRRN